MKQKHTIATTLHERLDHLFYLLWKRNEKLNRRLDEMAGELDRVLADVTQIRGKVTSMATLLAKLADLIRNNAGDPAALTKIADDLEASSAEAQAAIDANDPDAQQP